MTNAPSGGPAVHMIYGFIGSGKSTFARKLEEELQGMRFSVDEWLTNFYGANPPSDMYLEFSERTASLIERQWVRAAELGLDVILDFGFWTRELRDAVRAKARSMGVPCTLYLIETDDETAIARACERSASPDSEGFTIDEKTYRELKAKFEPLGTDEPHLVVPR